MNLLTKQKQIHRGEERGERIVREFEVGMYTHVFKMDNQQRPTI